MVREDFCCIWEETASTEAWCIWREFGEGRPKGVVQMFESLMKPFSLKSLYLFAVTKQPPLQTDGPRRGLPASVNGIGVPVYTLSVHCICLSRSEFLEAWWVLAFLSGYSPGSRKLIMRPWLLPQGHFLFWLLPAVL